MEKRLRYQSPGWRLARERIGQLVRDNYRIDHEMSPRLAALRDFDYFFRRAWWQGLRRS
jgi:hypothetical protein